MRGARDVADNGIGAEGGAKVAEALTMNSTLTHLDLACEGGGMAGGRGWGGGRGRGGDGAERGMVMMDDVCGWLDVEMVEGG